MDTKKIVYCKDCKYFNPFKIDRVSKGECTHPQGMCKILKPSDYCSLAQERINHVDGD